MDDDEGELKADASSAFYIESWIDPAESKIKSLWAWPDPEMVPLQIAICGTAGTGKKKLARQLGRRLDIQAVSGVARTVQRTGHKLNKSARWDDEFAAFLGQVWEQCEYEEYVTAGSVIEVVAHAHHFVENYGTKKDAILLRGLTNLCNTIANNDYTVTFYLPLEHKPKSDGVRSVDMKYLAEIDKLIRHYLDAFDLDYFPVMGNNTEKYDLCMSYLEDFGLLIDRD